MRYLFFHAHPDDETLSTGAIICGLTAAGHEVLVLTATRGEMGQAVEGSIAPGTDLTEVRMYERTAALAALQATDAGWLGEPPNRAGCDPRVYRDSGMEWVSPMCAGPSPDSSPDSFWRADFAEISADLWAALRYYAPDVVVSYDTHGGYGHPDHVRCHEVAVRVTTDLGVPFAQITVEEGTGVLWFDAGDDPRLIEAHRAYSTQFSVRGERVVHVGGQDQGILRAAGLTIYHAVRDH